MWLRTSLVLLGLVVATACDAGEPGPPSNGSPDALEEDGPVKGPHSDLAIGVNSPEPDGPEDFLEAQDGDELPVTLGPQGLWMVSLALRTTGDLHGTFVLEASLLDQGRTMATLMRKRQRLVSMADGCAYYFDGLLILDGIFLSGDPVQVAVTVEDSLGHRVRVERSVVLTTKPLPAYDD